MNNKYYSLVKTFPILLVIIFNFLSYSTSASDTSSAGKSLIPNESEKIFTKAFDMIFGDSIHPDSLYINSSGKYIRTAYGNMDSLNAKYGLGISGKFMIINFPKELITSFDTAGHLVNFDVSVIVDSVTNNILMIYCGNSSYRTAKSILSKDIMYDWINRSQEFHGYPSVIPEVSLINALNKVKGIRDSPREIYCMCIVQSLLPDKKDIYPAWVVACTDINRAVRSFYPAPNLKGPASSKCVINAITNKRMICGYNTDRR